MTAILIMWIIADALLFAALIIHVFCPIYHGAPSLWEQWRNRRKDK